MQAFTRFASTLQTYEVPLSKVYATATSAFRSAKNGMEIVQQIFQNFGILIHIIKGTDEAQFIYEGVRQATPIKDKTALIIDIGGGSVEFILGNDTKIFWKQSFEIGGQRLLDQFMRTDPISQLDLQRLEIYLETALLELTQILFRHTPHMLVGSAGAFEMVVAMTQYIREQQITLVDEHGELIEKCVKIDKDEFYILYQKIVQANHEERKSMQGMLEIRADMIVVAMALIKFILEKINVQHFFASAYSLKEGVLFSKILTK
jgi:exopolyphosphatase/guanosine-5'-triphosphate,3'-diphosphate pyrophosphatase